jgi:hypothetical protein
LAEVEEHDFELMENILGDADKGEGEHDSDRPGALASEVKSMNREDPGAFVAHFPGSPWREGINRSLRKIAYLRAPFPADGRLKRRNLSSKMLPTRPKNSGRARIEP